MGEENIESTACPHGLNSTVRAVCYHILLFKTHLAKMTSVLYFLFSNQVNSALLSKINKLLY